MQKGCFTKKRCGAATAPAPDDNSLGAIYSMPCNAGHVIAIDSFQEFCHVIEGDNGRTSGEAVVSL